MSIACNIPTGVILNGMERASDVVCIEAHINRVKLFNRAFAHYPTNGRKPHYRFLIAITDDHTRQKP